ncbi:hypothetical protein F5884DRAFT_202855 [Xylogone sp. PMI_703]|nr:hypothetical protein F5884DRAFT_202855 [Xylogone sp. PMI_703]
MPRASPATKRPQGAGNQRDTRHENGLVGPGRRVQKQKSNGHLNGQARSTESIPPTPPLPATPPLSNGHARQHAGSITDSDSKMASLDSLRRSSVTGYDESSSSESYHNIPTISVSHHPNHRQIDVNNAKNPAVHRDTGALGLAFTVLKSCPLYDTIAILIVLLQIPPTFLSIVHLLFATLTFVPPSATTNVGFSFTDVFEGTLGTPSVATIVVVDLIVLLVWLFLWSPLQDIALDLAQTVIALTLGGGTSGREAGANNVLVCFSIVAISRFLRSGSIKQSGLRALLSSSGGLLGSPDPDDPLEVVPHSGKGKGAHSWIRSILAIHILTQGVVRYIRDWYVRREKRDTSSSTLGDPEAGKGSLFDVGNESSTPHGQSAETESSIPLPTSNPITTKKKRKQSALVRTRQPLWAALASTKIVMIKEYESSHAAAESAGTNATDVNNLGNAPFDSESDRIWITYVGFDEVYFNTSFFPAYSPPPNISGDEGKQFPAAVGIDKTKPFFVKVNNAPWQPTRINAMADTVPGRDIRWSGEIFGLAPMSSYQFDFVSTIDGSIIFSTSVRTSPAPTADMAAAAGLTPNGPSAGRPGSPITTLKTSIASSEVKLTEERNRQKRERKEQRAKLNTARKEIEKLSNNIASSGGNDDRLRQKVQQSNLHMRQAEEALVTLTTQIQSLESIPTDESGEWKSAKEAFQAERDVHKQYRQEYNNAKQAMEKEIQVLSNELAALQQKHERMQSRIAKLNGEHDRIADANARGLDEAQLRATQRQARESERAKIETLYLERLHAITAQIQETSSNLQAVLATIDALQQAEFFAAQQAQQVQAQPSPTTSMSNIPNPYDISADGVAAANAMAMSAYPWNPPVHAYVPMQVSTSTPGRRTRGRSSSMLSNVSGFTQSSNEDQPSLLGGGPLAHLKMNERSKQRSDESSSASGSGIGLGSGSGSGSGSISDPKSPIGKPASTASTWEK